MFIMYSQFHKSLPFSRVRDELLGELREYRKTHRKLETDCVYTWSMYSNDPMVNYIVF